VPNVFLAPLFRAQNCLRGPGTPNTYVLVVAYEYPYGAMQVSKLAKPETRPDERIIKLS
jgi:hypothetical protein